MTAATSPARIEAADGAEHHPLPPHAQKPAPPGRPAAHTHHNRALTGPTPSGMTCASGSGTPHHPANRRKGIDTSQRLGRHRWKIERTLSWLFATADSPFATKRHGHLLAAFLTLAAALTCFKKLTQITT